MPNLSKREINDDLCGDDDDDDDDDDNGDDDYDVNIVDSNDKFNRIVIIWQMKPATCESS